MGKNKKLKKLVMLHTLLWMMIGANKKRKCEHFLTKMNFVYIFSFFLHFFCQFAIIGTINRKKWER